jgi:methionyl aminopeptidase
MNIRLKTDKEMQILAKGGAKLSEILKKLAKAVKPGAETADLEKLAGKLIKEAGGEPAFLGYETGGGRYPAALCVSVNEAVVHTPATLNYKIKDGDVVSLDLGLWYDGLCTDAATTVIAGKADAKARRLCDATRQALKEAVRECKAGRSVSVIGARIEKIIAPLNFGIVRDLVGHGVGHGVHEDPMVPNYYDKAFDKIIMKEGLVIAIEPMITLGSGDIEMAEDGFTYRTADSAVAAHFEATVAITKRGPKIITPIV